MKNVYVIGPFNTGTNLVHKLFETSQCINNTTGEKLFIRYPKHQYWKGICNKHLTNVKIINSYVKNSDSLIIIMYKNIFNWIYSLKKESYDIKFAKIDDPITFLGNKYKNTVQLYNYYYSMYMFLIKQNKNVMFLDYEKIINKDTCFEYINLKLENYNLHLSSKAEIIKVLNKPSKTHGNPVNNSDEALELYLKNQTLVKTFLLKNTHMHKDVNQNIIDYFEN
jgi:hypothetical protein